MVTASQGFRHWYIIGKALLQLHTKDELIVLVEQEILVFSFLEALFFLGQQSIDKHVVIEEILLQFGHFIFWHFLLVVIFQDLDDTLFKYHFQVQVELIPKESDIN